MKNKNVVLITLSVVALALVVVFGGVMGILKATNVIESDFSVFEIVFTILLTVLA